MGTFFCMRHLCLQSKWLTMMEFTDVLQRRMFPQHLICPVDGGMDGAESLGIEHQLFMLFTYLGTACLQITFQTSQLVLILVWVLTNAPFIMCLHNCIIRILCQTNSIKQKVSDQSVAIKDFFNFRNIFIFYQGLEYGLDRSKENLPCKFTPLIGYSIFVNQSKSSK